MEKFILCPDYETVHKMFSQKDILNHCYLTKNLDFYSKYLDYCLEHIEDEVQDMNYGTLDTFGLFRTYTRYLLANKGNLDKDNPRAKSFRHIISMLSGIDNFNNIQVEHRDLQTFSVYEYNNFALQCIQKSRYTDVLCSLVYDRYLSMFSYGIRTYYMGSKTSKNPVFNHVVRWELCNPRDSFKNPRFKKAVGFLVDDELFNILYSIISLNDCRQEIDFIYKVSGLSQKDFIHRLKKIIEHENWPVMDYTRYINLLTKFGMLPNERYSLAVRDNIDFIRKLNSMNIVFIEQQKEETDKILELLSLYTIRDLSVFILEYICE